MTEGTLCVVQMNWVLGEFCYKKKHDLYINNTFHGTDSLPFLIIPILFLNFLPVLLQPTSNSRPESWWLCDSVSFSIICVTVMQSSCIHWTGVLSLWGPAADSRTESRHPVSAGTWRGRGFIGAKGATP